MLAAILLVTMAVLGAAGSLGYDIARPFQYALGAVGILYDDGRDAPPLERDQEIPFVPTVGPAGARLESEALHVVRHMSLASLPAEAPAASASVSEPPPASEPTEP
jgi:hypothetical protein